LESSIREDGEKKKEEGMKKRKKEKNRGDQEE